ncbi:cytochrome c [Duganella sp. BJB488]|uniref:c-type cytochrome n=1 Tax=unclassified Duganella TaxID=2636909 RepID=UPI000E356B2B|nr:MULTISPECIES: cytochrome c [unclassified Duganella]RFP13957.1 cytochrome c [Duganella sp. BJB489]RFP17459.1 cytochrome c [Duganella sp. BJB488]RFP31752.1 cytochrome c [Duganella sp. BJB480]
MKEALIKAAMVLVALLAAGASAPSRAQQMDGKALFLKNCAACHQPTGKGIPGAFPALAGNKFVQGKGTDVATVLLKGRGGMPDFSDSLSDAEIATVLSFVRSSWGNQGAPLSESEVLALRDTLQVDHFSNGQMSNKH